MDIENNDFIEDNATDEKLEVLINEFSLQRDELNVMIKDLEKIKEKIELLFPENLDKRYIRFFEEKMKSLTSLFGTILDIRKEIMKSVKTEFDLRKNIKDLKEKDDILEDLNIDDMEKIITNLQDTNKKQKEKRMSLRKKGESHVRLESIN
jgi:hypothetical protein